MTKNWPRYINKVVTAINKSPNSAIGGLRPYDIQSPEDGVLIDERIGVKEDVPVAEQIANQRRYEQDKSKLQVGNYVYLDFKPKALDKSFDTRRNQIFRVVRIDAGKKVPLFKLVDLLKAPVKGYFYREELLKTRKPRMGEDFKVEDIVGEKTVRGKEYVRVKYLHYGDKFNKWILKKNLIKGAA